MYRVTFFSGPAHKSSKYGTGPTQKWKMTEFTKDSNISTKQARKSSEDVQAGYAQFEKVWAG